MPQTKLKGMTTIEALLVAAAFIIVGVIGVMVFQGMGKSLSEALRANVIVTADKGGFDVTVEVLNGKLSALQLMYNTAGSTNLNTGQQAYCVTPSGQVTIQATYSNGRYTFNPPLVAGQSVTCRFAASLASGQQYTYVVYAIDGSTGKAVQVAKGVVTIGIS